MTSCEPPVQKTRRNAKNLLPMHKSFSQKEIQFHGVEDRRATTAEPLWSEDSAEAGLQAENQSRGSIPIEAT